MAVLLFFYLSGYWVSKIWSERFASSGTLRFYAARYLRIAPLYLLTMLAAAVLLGVGVRPENFLLLGVASGRHDPLIVAWSLDVELQFYILLPLIAVLFAQSTRMVVIVAMLTSALAWIFAERLGVVTVFQYLPAFVLGGLAFAKAWRPSERTAAISLAAFLAMTAFAWFTPFMTKSTPDPFDRDIFAFFWMLPLLPYVTRSLHERSTPVDRHLGNLSFPLYLVHAPLVVFARNTFENSGLVKGTAVLVAIVVALALYVFVDRRVDAWRVRVTEAQPLARARARAALAGAPATAGQRAPQD